MAGPAARRKIRNPTKKVSRRTQDKHFKRKSAAHPLLAGVWDKRKTTKANYEAIGLALTLNSATASKPSVLETSSVTAPAVGEDEDDETAETAATPTPQLITETGKRIPLSSLAATLHNGVVVQAARIQRDDDGNVVGYEMDSLNPLDPEFDAVLARARDAAPKTQTVQNLIAFSQRHHAHIKLPSSGELDWMHRLVNKHGDDVAKMVRDRQLNAFQHTPAQLRKKLDRYWTFLREYEIKNVADLIS